MRVKSGVHVGVAVAAMVWCVGVARAGSDVVFSSVHRRVSANINGQLLENPLTPFSDQQAMADFGASPTWTGTALTSAQFNTSAHASQQSTIIGNSITLNASLGVDASASPLLAQVQADATSELSCSIDLTGFAGRVQFELMVDRAPEWLVFRLDSINSAAGAAFTSAESRIGILEPRLYTLTWRAQLIGQNVATSERQLSASIRFIPEPPTRGACCAGSVCIQLDQSECVSPGQRFIGVLAACNGPGRFATPCCKADFNQNGSIGTQDIFDFLTAWFRTDSLADINGQGVGVQDIFDFLTAWLGGC